MVVLSPLSLPGSSTSQKQGLELVYQCVVRLVKYKLYVNLSCALPHRDLCAIREFEHNRKPICPNNFMAVKEEV